MRIPAEIDPYNPYNVNGSRLKCFFTKIPEPTEDQRRQDRQNLISQLSYGALNDSDKNGEDILPKYAAAPPNIDIHSNIAEIKGMNQIDIYHAFRNCGKYDYKQLTNGVNRTYEYFGNWHYGFTLKIKDLPVWYIHAAAGFAQLLSGNRDGNDISTLFDAPEDYDAIDQGIEAARQYQEDQKRYEEKVEKFLKENIKIYPKGDIVTPPKDRFDPTTDSRKYYA